MKSVTDLDAARGGDRDAILRLIQRHEPRLRKLVHERLGARLREKIATSDVLQSAYLDLLKDFGGFRGGTTDEFVAWCAHLIENNIRDKAKFFEARKRQPPGVAPVEALESRIAPGPGPHSLNALFEDLQIVHAALSRLSDDHRAVIQLKAVHGLSHEEIAARLGRTEAAARILLVRARAALLLEIEAVRKTGPPPADDAGKH